MTKQEAPAVPPGLGAAGSALWLRLHAEFKFSDHEDAQLEQAAAQADDVAALEAEVADAGYMVDGAGGRPRLNPAVPELRLARLALNKLLSSLCLPDEADVPRSAGSKAAAHAATSRWNQTRQQRARLAGDG